MITRITFASIAVIFCFAFCKSSQKSTASSSTKQETIVNTNTESLSTDSYRFIVSFYSIGGGPDMKGLKEFKDFVTTFSTKLNKSISPEIFSWGREGESDYCYKLSGLNDKEQKQFITEANVILAKSKLVHVSENEACRHKRK